MKKRTTGGVSIKNINNKEYYYYQWYEDGKKRSKLISKEEYDEIKKDDSQILQLSQENYYPGLKLYTGDILKQNIEIVKNFKVRNQFDYINDFINKDPSGHILVLYGLRRTGKTTLIFQVLSKLSEEDFNKSAYILISRSCKIDYLNLTLNKLYKEGYKYVFIDEITYIDDFIYNSQFIADIYGNLMHIIISGTDSLGFMITSKNELYDRAVLVHTTYISFKEFSNVLGINSIDEYIEYGGTMIKEGINYHNDKKPVFYDEDTTISYIDSAIVSNIEHTLKKCEEEYTFLRIKELYKEGMLTDLIQRVIQDENHQFLASVINKKFKSRDFGSLKQLVRNKDNEFVRTFLDQYDEEELYKNLIKSLEIINNKDLISQNAIIELKTYLMMLDVIANIIVYDFDFGKTIQKQVFTQPGLRYSQTKVLLEEMLKREEFALLPFEIMNIFKETLLNDVKGKMLEEIVILETSRHTKDMVFKGTFINGEVDMIRYNRLTNEVSLYEIKHTKKHNEFQTRYLNDPTILSKVEQKFGHIKEKVVLYQGESFKQGKIDYINVNEYLNSL